MKPLSPISQAFVTSPKVSIFNHEKRTEASRLSFENSADQKAIETSQEEYKRQSQAQTNTQKKDNVSSTLQPSMRYSQGCFTIPSLQTKIGVLSPQETCNLRNHELPTFQSSKNRKESKINFNKQISGTQVDFLPQHSKATHSFCATQQQFKEHVYNLDINFVDEKEIARVCNSLDQKHKKLMKLDHVNELELQNLNNQVQQQLFNPHDMVLLNNKPKLKRTFDNRIVEDINPRKEFQEFYPQKFDFSEYEFQKGKANKVNCENMTKKMALSMQHPQVKQNIFKNIQEIIFDHVQTEVNSKFDSIPDFIRKPNTKKFYSLFLESSTVKKMLINFVESLDQVLKNELSKNQEMAQMFLAYPRTTVESPTIKHFSVYEAEQKKLAENNLVFNTLFEAQNKFNYKQEKEKQKIKEKYGYSRSIMQDKDGNFIDSFKPSKHCSVAKLNQSTSKSPENNQITNQNFYKGKPRLKFYTEFQTKLKERTEVIERLVKSMDEDTQDYLKQTKKVEIEINELQEEARINKYPIVPGVQVAAVLQQIANQPNYSRKDIKKFQRDMWLTLAQFENKLESEVKGHEMQTKIKENQFRIQMSSLKEKTQFRIECLQQALLDLKLTKNREIDQLNMYIAELESSLFNIKKKENDLDKVIHLYSEENLEIKTMREAKDIIAKLVNVIKQNKEQINLADRNLETAKLDYGVLNKKMLEAQEVTALEAEYREFYQHLLLKFCRDIHMFAKAPKNKQMAFNSINEFAKEFEQQKLFRQKLETEIDFAGEMINLANKILGTNLNLEKVHEKLTDKGIVPQLRFNNNQNVFIYEVTEQVKKAFKGVNTGPKATPNSGNPKGDKTKKANPATLKSRVSMRKFSKVSGIDSSKNSISSKRQQHQSNKKDTESDINNSPLVSKQNSISKQKQSGLQKAFQKLDLQETQINKVSDFSSNSSHSFSYSNSKDCIIPEANIPISKQGSVYETFDQQKFGSPSYSNRTKLPYEKPSNISQQNIEQKKSKPKPVFESDLDLQQVFSALKAKLNGDQIKELDKIMTVLKQHKSAEKQVAKSLKEQSFRVNKTPQNDSFNFQIPKNQQVRNKEQNTLLLPTKQQTAQITNKPPKFDSQQKRSSSLRIILTESSELQEKAKEIKREKERSSARKQESNKTINQLVIQPQVKDEISVSVSSSKTAIKSIYPPSKINKKEIELKVIDATPKSTKKTKSPVASSPKSIKTVVVSKKGNSSQPPTTAVNKLKIKLNETKIGGQKTPKKQNVAQKQSSKSNKQSVNTDIQPLPAICIIEKELNQLVASTFSKMIQEASDTDAESFKINVTRIQELQDIVRMAINTQLSYDEIQDLFKSDLASFTEHFNKFIVTSFGFEKVQNFIASDGQRITEQQLPGKQKKKDNPQPAHKPKFLPKEEGQIRFGDALKPVIDMNGELLGFKVREELVKSLFIKNQLDFKVIKRLLKLCIYFNRMLNTGHLNDFQLKEMEDGQEVTQPVKEYAEAQLQVDVEELQMNFVKEDQGHISELSKEQEEDNETSTIVLEMLKTHAIDIATRENPSRKAYYNMIWKGIDFEKLLEYKLTNVFVSEETKLKDHLGVGVSVKNYFQTVFQLLNKKLQEHFIYKEERDLLVINNLVFKNPLEDVDDDQVNMKVNKQVKAKVQEFKEQYEKDHYKETKHIAVETGPELMPPPRIIERQLPPQIIVEKIEVHKATKQQIKSKNQVVLDKALEDEFNKTLEVMDVFIQSISKLDPNKLKMQAYETARQKVANLNKQASRKNSNTSLQHKSTGSLETDKLLSIRNKLKDVVVEVKDSVASLRKGQLFVPMIETAFNQMMTDQSHQSQSKSILEQSQAMLNQNSGVIYFEQSAQKVKEISNQDSMDSYQKKFKNNQIQIGSLDESPRQPQLSLGFGYPLFMNTGNAMHSPNSLPRQDNLLYQQPGKQFQESVPNMLFNLDTSKKQQVHSSLFQGLSNLNRSSALGGGSEDSSQFIFSGLPNRHKKVVQKVKQSVQQQPSGLQGQAQRRRGPMFQSLDFANKMSPGQKASTNDDKRLTTDNSTMPLKDFKLTKLNLDMKHVHSIVEKTRIMEDQNYRELALQMFQQQKHIKSSSIDDRTGIVSTSLYKVSNITNQQTHKGHKNKRY